MTFWPLTNSDLPTNQTFHQFHDLYTELDLHRIMSGFHGAFATGVASQQGTLTLPDTWFRPPLWDLLMLQLLRPNSSNLPCLYSTFHLEYPLVLSRFYFCQTQANFTGFAGMSDTFWHLCVWLIIFFFVVCDTVDQVLTLGYVTLYNLYILLISSVPKFPYRRGIENVSWDQKVQLFTEIIYHNKFMK